MKTLQEIWDDLDIHSQQALFVNDIKLALGSKEIEKEYYSEAELHDKIEKARKELKKEMCPNQKDMCECGICRSIEKILGK